MSVKQERIAKLPKWAQIEIQRLSANADYWEQQVRQMNDGDTNVFIQTGEDNISLPRDSSISFSVGNHWSEHVDVRHSSHGRMLDIFGGGREIFILPRASNHFQVGLISE